MFSLSSSKEEDIARLMVICSEAYRMRKLQMLLIPQQIYEKTKLCENVAYIGKHCLSIFACMQQRRKVTSDAIFLQGYDAVRLDEKSI